VEDRVAQDDDLTGGPVPEASGTEDGAELLVYPRRNRDLFQYLITTFQSMLPAEKAAVFDMIAAELERSIHDNCQICRITHQQATAEPPRDLRRSRFLLRLVVSRVSHLFAGDKAILPRSLIEGMDRYMKKAFGSVIYAELDAEADELLYRVNCDDDREMWEKIRTNPQWCRFVDTIFIRILFRFENFANGKKTFMAILEVTMQEVSRFTFTDDHFALVFEAMFSELWTELENEEQRIRWDFMFGDGTSKRLEAILRLGLVRYLKRKDSKVLGSGRVVAADKSASRSPSVLARPKS